MRSLCFLLSFIMQYKTKPTDKPSDYYMFGLGLGGIAFWIISSYGRMLTALFQFISIAMLAFALFILLRYRLTSFCLKIEGKNGAAADVSCAMAEELDFVVERLRGKNPVTLARLSLGDLKRADVVRYSDLATAAKGASLYKYQADMSPDEGVLLIFGTEDTNIAIFTDMPGDMRDLLKRTADNNKNIQ